MLVADDGTVIVMRDGDPQSTPLELLTREEAIAAVRALGREVAACRVAQRRTLEGWSRFAQKVLAARGLAA